MYFLILISLICVNNAVSYCLAECAPYVADFLKCRIGIGNKRGYTLNIPGLKRCS